MPPSAFRACAILATRGGEHAADANEATAATQAGAAPGGTGGVRAPRLSPVGAVLARGFLVNLSIQASPKTSRAARSLCR